jgi:hypothetical protein
MTVEIRDYSDDELRAIPAIEVAPGELGADGIRRGRELSNPFKGVDDDLAHRWSQLHWGEKPAVAAPTSFDMADPFGGLLDTLGTLSGNRLFHEVKNADGEVVSIHALGVNPRDPVAVAAWEKSCQEMHQSQTLILPPEKPGAPMRKAPVVEQEGPINFEDSEESRKLRGLKRGD